MLLSYSKLVAFQQLLESDVPEDPYLSKELERYFPQPLQAKYAKAMQQHRLKREIIATAVTNSTINRMGATFLLRMQEDSGRTPGEVAKAFTITRETLDARDLWAQVDALDGKVAESVQIDALLVIWNLQRSFTRWLLSRARRDSRHHHRGGALPRRLPRHPRRRWHPSGSAAPGLRGQPAQTGATHGVPQRSGRPAGGVAVPGTVRGHHRAGARAQAEARWTWPRCTSAWATR